MPSSISPATEKHSLAKLDEAAIYLNEHDVDAEDVSSVSQSQLLRRIDWHIMPIAFACYTMQYLDKAILNYAAVMGLKEDLFLRGNDFTNTATALSVAFLVAEFPNAPILQKVPAGKWLGINAVLWGISTALTATVKNYHGLLACRIFLGIFEAATAPSLLLITGMWYTHHEAVPRFALWYSGIGVASALGGVLSYGFQHIEGASIASWRIMFIALGILTSLVGVWTFLCMPDSPMSARWLTTAEKHAALARVKANQTGVQNRQFKWGQVKELFLDFQIWVLAIMGVLSLLGSGLITTYSSTIIKGFGYTSQEAALLGIPIGVLMSIFILLSARLAQRTSRWLMACVTSLIAMVGGGLLSFLSTSNKAGMLTGIYLLSAVVPTMMFVYSWAVANVAGQTKRVAANSLMLIAFSVGSMVGPQTFQARDAPDYLPAKISLLAAQAALVALAIGLRVYYGWQNGKRDTDGDSADTAGPVSDDVAWMNLTDRENKLFRYQY